MKHSQRNYSSINHKLLHCMKHIAAEHKDDPSARRCKIILYPYVIHHWITFWFLNRPFDTDLHRLLISGIICHLHHQCAMFQNPPSSGYLKIPTKDYIQQMESISWTTGHISASSE